VGGDGVRWAAPLAKLSTFKLRCEAAEKMKTQVAPAFEAVAATLTQLSLEGSEDSEWLDDGAAVGHELGPAVGKSRRLEDLALDLFRDGRGYHVVARVRMYPSHIVEASYELTIASLPQHLEQYNRALSKSTRSP
jgi:hypothetical protein